MINLLQENIEIKTYRTNCTPARSAGGFSFCQPTRNQPEKTKRAISFQCL